MVAGLSFDTAIRMYLESFRLPGEAQKINRIMESFGRHYHRQCPTAFANADAVYVLAYSVIILNTDQHNNQVRANEDLWADSVLQGAGLGAAAQHPPHAPMNGCGMAASCPAGLAIQVQWRSGGAHQHRVSASPAACACRVADLSIQC